ncbi:MAG: hypothetical protein RI885_2197 [Actinomycetota bacterium]
MIVTLTANPSLDRTIELPSALERGEVQRAFATREQPGGKGVNVSRALIASGIETVAVLPGRDVDPMILALLAEHIPCAGLAIDGRIRSNVTLTEPDGTTTKVNEPGPTLSVRDAAALVDLVIATASGAQWIVLAGSLPPGLPADFYATVIRALHATGSTTRIAVDSSGAPLAALIASGVGVDLVKPNAEELAELTGLEVAETDPASAAAAARMLVADGCRAVLATLGAHGAVLVTAEGAWHATMPPIVPKSTVGAGDSSLAGYLLADGLGASASESLAQAVAHGTAAAALPGSTMPSASDASPELASVVSITPHPQAVTVTEQH